MRTSLWTQSCSNPASFSISPPLLPSSAPVLLLSRSSVARSGCETTCRGYSPTVIYSDARCEHAARWSARWQASGTMDSHFLAVSGVSSCSQRSQVESNKTRTRNAYDQEAKRTAILTPKRDGFCSRAGQWDDGFTPSWYPQSSWRCAWASPVKMKMNLNGLSSGVARVVERCKPSTEECEQLLLPLPHQTGAAVHRSSSSSSSSSSSCFSPEYATDASATRVHPYSRSCR